MSFKIQLLETSPQKKKSPPPPGQVKNELSEIFIMNWQCSIQCCGYKKFWYGSGCGSADPYLWLMDPDQDQDRDPVIFVSDLPI
jgi:hypothetical protein